MITIATIRKMPLDTPTQIRLVEAACLEALVMRPIDEVVHAELLYTYAFAMTVAPERRGLAATKARRAYELAFRNRDFILAAKALLLELYCKAATLTIQVFWTEFQDLERMFTQDWYGSLYLSDNQMDVIRDELERLRRFGATRR